MIDIPLNKALVAVESDSCMQCILRRECSITGECTNDIGCIFACAGAERKDGKNVIFKLVDLPEEDKK